jgi:hypothetical protein
VLILKALVVLHDKGVVEAPQQVLLLSDVLEEGVLFDFLLAVAL